MKSWLKYLISGIIFGVIIFLISSLSNFFLVSSLLNSGNKLSFFYYGKFFFSCIFYGVLFLLFRLIFIYFNKKQWEISWGKGFVVGMLYNIILSVLMFVPVLKTVRIVFNPVYFFIMRMEFFRILALLGFLGVLIMTGIVGIIYGVIFSVIYLIYGKINRPDYIRQPSV